MTGSGIDDVCGESDVVCVERVRERERAEEPQRTK